MKPYFFAALFFFVSCVQLHAQDEDGDFPFGKVTRADLQQTVYALDSSAIAIVLNEFGRARLDNENDHNLLFDYHVRIKILKQDGLKYADIEIPLYKTEKNAEKLRDVKASSFSFIDNRIVESGVLLKNVYTENRQYSDIKKFAIPNVRVGSIVEFTYTLESPFIYKFRSWEFQSPIPKVYSEYCAKIPGNYLYNVTLKGFLELTKNESSVERECFAPGGGNRSDCSVFKFGMKDIPAFIEEDFMTAKSNFLSAINFELSEIRYFDGRVDKVTKEWRDAEIELKRHLEFGAQIRKADGLMKDILPQIVGAETDPVKKAKKIYQHVISTYTWNQKNGMFTDQGVKKAFDTKTGNVADINFILMGALQEAGFDAEPVILSTRENGLPIEIHPVISDFNYLVVRVTLNDKSVLLDATDPFHPFGLLPERCLNGKGRVISDKTSFWIDLKATERAKRVATVRMSLKDDGFASGSFQTTYLGYEGVKMRKEISRFNGTAEFIRHLSDKIPGLEIRKFDIQNYEDPERPLAISLDINLQVFDESSANNFLLSPFFFDREKENPFKSTNRIYPVDFGSPRELITVFHLEFPEKFEIVNNPEKIALSLPNSGGRFIFEAAVQANRLQLSNSLLINKAVYSSDEYKFLRELYSRIVQAHNEDLVFRRKM